MKINEIQPFATDQDGKSINSWVELRVNDYYGNFCFISTSEGNYYSLPVIDITQESDLFTVEAIETQGAIEYLRLPNPSGRVALSESSDYMNDRPVILPFDEVAYDDLEKTQTHALFNEGSISTWAATYKITQGSENIFSSSPELIIEGDPYACSALLINEIFPNPNGADSGSEWLEIYNNTSAPVSLDQCIISIELDKYYFKTGSTILANEFKHFTDLYNEDGDNKKISLTNSGETILNLSRLYKGELELIQSFAYSDSPEGMSYARFEEGWAWTFTDTPSSSNKYLAEKPKPILTDAKASFATAAIPTSSSSKKKSVSPSKTTTQKSSSKSLSSTAKSTTGAKSTNQRDIYESPEELSDSKNTSYIFVVIGVMAVVYAIYEYRLDIQNFYFKRRRNKVAG